jgi:hypothetical protein
MKSGAAAMLKVAIIVVQRQGRLLTMMTREMENEKTELFAIV